MRQNHVLRVKFFTIFWYIERNKFLVSVWYIPKELFTSVLMKVVGIHLAALGHGEYPHVFTPTSLNNF